MAIARIANRVRQGGHYVPEADIRRRFAAGLRNFHELYRPLADEWRIHDGSEYPFRVVASWADDTLEVVDSDLYDPPHCAQGSGRRRPAQPLDYSRCLPL
ncbi:MAG: hypothetical protein WED34_07110 [Planctomycetales bacterium]